MLDSCPLPQRPSEALPQTWAKASMLMGGSIDSRGFTLLEILVVLILVGLVAVVAPPQFARLADSVAFALERESFERAINGLPYQAYKRGIDLELKSRAIGPSSVSTSATPTRGFPGQTVPAILDAPGDWQLSVAEPIIYRASGYCTGGVISIDAGHFQERYVLRPPHCKAEGGR